MKKKLLIFHIGFPKTGTTYLQKNFLNFKEIEPLYHLKKHNSFWKLNNYLFNNNVFASYEMNNKKIIQNFIENVKKIKTEKKILLYSYEGILNPYRFNLKKNLRNFYTIIKHLKKDYRIKILLSIREQNDLIKSWYITEYDILRHKFKDLDSFLKNEMSKKRINKFLNYYYLDGHLKKSTQIKPQYIFFEDLKRNKILFENELSNILELKKKIKLSKEKANVTKKNKNRDYLVIDNELYYFLNKINLQINKRIKYFHFFTKPIKAFIKSLLKEKKLKNNDNLKFNYYFISNKKFFKKIKLKNKFI